MKTGLAKIGFINLGWVAGAFCALALFATPAAAQSDCENAGGVVVDGACYFYDAVKKQSCDQVCAPRGGCDLAGTRAIGTDDQSGASCLDVIDALEANGTSTASNLNVRRNNNRNAIGCHVRFKFDRVYISKRYATTCSAKAGDRARFCACNLDTTPPAPVNNAPELDLGAVNGAALNGGDGSAASPFAISLTEGDLATIALDASDVDGDATTISCSGTNAVVSLAGSTLSVSTASGDAGTYALACAATDGDLDSATLNIDVTVDEQAPPPPPPATEKNFGAVSSPSVSGEDQFNIAGLAPVVSDNGHKFVLGQLASADTVPYCHFNGSWTCGQFDETQPSGGQNSPANHDVAADAHGNFWIAITDRVANSGSAQFRLKVIRLCNGANGFSGCTSGGFTTWSDVVNGPISAVSEYFPLSIGVAKDGDHVAVAYPQASDNVNTGELRVTRWESSTGWNSPEDPDATNLASGAGYPDYDAFGTGFRYTHPAVDLAQHLVMADNGDFWVALLGDSQTDVYARRYCFDASAAGCSAKGWDGAGVESVYSGSDTLRTLVLTTNRADSDDAAILVSGDLGGHIANNTSGSWNSIQISTNRSIGSIKMNASSDAMAVYGDMSQAGTTELRTKRLLGGAWQADVAHALSNTAYYADLTFDDAGDGAIAWSNYFVAPLIQAKRLVGNAWQSTETVQASVSVSGWAVQFAEKRDGTGTLFFTNGSANYLDGATVQFSDYE